MITQYKFEITGNDSETISDVFGKILSVTIDYDGSALATTDVTLADDKSQSIVSISNSNTDTTIYPRTAATNSSGGNFTYDGSKPVPVKFPVYGSLTATVAQNTAGLVTTIIVIVER